MSGCLFYDKCFINGWAGSELEYKYDLARNQSPSSSVVKAPDRHRGKMHCARAVFLLLVNAPLLKTIGKKNKLGFRPRILKNLSSRHQT